MLQLQYLYERVFLVSIHLLLCTLLIAQKKEYAIGLSVPLQIDFEKKSIGYPIINSPQEQRNSILNYGADIFIGRGLTNHFAVYTGLGFFKKKFNFKQFYNHELLNQGNDSILIGTSTRNYTYKFIRSPVGFLFSLRRDKKVDYKFGMDFYFNWIFQKKYIGSKPYPEANNRLSKFQYSGNSLNLVFDISNRLNHTSLLEIEPYLEIYSVCKKDEVLLENPKEKNKQYLDAVGIRLKYLFTLNNHL